MRMIKISSILLFSFLFMWTFMPELSAKTRTSFSFNLNLGPRPRYVEVYPAPVPVPAPTYAVVAPYPGRAYYPSPYYGGVVVERPYMERVYVNPYYSYWGY